MTLSKRVQLYLLGLFGYVVLSLLHRTIRWDRNDFIGGGDKQHIFALWHSIVLFAPFAYRRAFPEGNPRGMHILVSRHFDGQLIGAVLNRLGHRTVAGSSTRGGATGALGLLRELSDGDDVAIMPDGPRGPAYEIKAGTIRIAEESGVPVYPIAAAYNRFWRLNSWDRMVIPKPFAKGVIVVGKPVSVPKGLDDAALESWKATLKESMMETLEEAESHVYS